MNSKNYIFDDIPEELDSNQINPFIGQKSPIIKPKLDDTIPSLLNLSEMSSLQKSNKNDSFNINHIDDFKINKNYFKLNTVIPLFNNNPNFNKTHIKAYSNENFTNPQIFNFLNIHEGEKSNKDEEDDNSSYYEGGLNFDGIINIWGDNNKEENDKKKILIEDENGNENEIEEDFHEGFNILNMLQKGKNKNNN